MQGTKFQVKLVFNFQLILNKNGRFCSLRSPNRPFFWSRDKKQLMREEQRQGLWHRYTDINSLLQENSSWKVLSIL